MISRAFKVSYFATTVLLGACGGGGSANPVFSPNGAPSQETALDAAKEFLAKVDFLRSGSPTSGSAYFALYDGCYLGDGYSKVDKAAAFDANPLSVASLQYVVGSTQTAPQVVAERTSTNADGSTRREIDIKYVTNYPDGTKNESAVGTIISGSSSGATLAGASTCTIPDNTTDWRFYGNRRVVQMSVSASNDRIERTALSTGLPRSPAVEYAKSISFALTDPAKVATYATLTGPGLGLGATGQLNGTPGSFKLLSPRLLRSAPELAGKRGNFIDLTDTTGFQFCSNAAGTGSASADTANCAVDGAYGTSINSSNSASGTVVDNEFAFFNIHAGDVYTVNVYGGDGWKTVNGQAGQTPIATYTSTLAALPLSAATLAGTGPTADLFARVTSSTKTAAEIASAIRTKVAISTAQTWTSPSPMPDGRAVALSYSVSSETGQANSTGATWPANGKSNVSYPSSLATMTTVNILAPTAALVVPTSASTALQYVNRNGNSINSRYSYF